MNSTRRWSLWCESGLAARGDVAAPARTSARYSGYARGAAEDPVPRPPQLERDVQFWVRVYTQVDTNSGFLHDQ